MSITVVICTSIYTHLMSGLWRRAEKDKKTKATVG